MKDMVGRDESAGPEVLLYGLGVVLLLLGVLAVVTSLPDIMRYIRMNAM